MISEETFNKHEQNPDVPYWLVDPLDGTREFINKSEEFTVNIALIQNGSAIFGIVGAPATSEIWHGSMLLMMIQGIIHRATDGGKTVDYG